MSRRPTWSRHQAPKNSDHNITSSLP